MSLSDKDIEALRQMEESLWREEARFDRQYFSRLLTEDFFEFGCSVNIYDRHSVFAAPRQETDAVSPLLNFSVRSLSDSVVQITYDSCVCSQDGVRYAHRNSIWSLEVDSWKLRFYQGTPYESGA